MVSKHCTLVSLTHLASSNFRAFYSCLMEPVPTFACLLPCFLACVSDLLICSADCTAVLRLAQQSHVPLHCICCTAWHSKWHMHRDQATLQSAPASPRSVITSFKKSAHHGSHIACDKTKPAALLSSATRLAISNTSNR